jgi:hypothetical protein
LQREPAFFSFFEQQYHLYLVKDLVKEGSPYVFEHKNTYTVREKFVIKSDNTIDFKLYLLQAYCIITNMSNEVFDRPYQTYYFKAFNADDEGLIRPIDKFETVNLNPCIIVMEDKSILNVYSMLEPDKHYFFKIEE